MIVKLIKGGLVIAAVQGVMFLLQTVLFNRGDHESIANLAAYTGVVSLAFYLHDGNSGIAYLQGLHIYSEAQLQAGFRAYRCAFTAIAVLLTVLAIVLGQREHAIFLISVTMSLAFRIYGTDGELDQIGFQPLVTAFANLWMLLIGIIALCEQRVDINTISLGALAGSLLSFAGRFIVGKKFIKRRKTEKLAGLGPVLHIFSFLGTYGIGQVYGRLSLTLLGAWFVGPVAAFAIYTKQTMNAVGILNALIRRIELSQHTGKLSYVTLKDFRWSLGLQIVSAFAIAAFLWLMARHSGIAAYVIFFVLLWQILEKFNSNQAFILQIMGKTGYAYAMLLTISSIGVSLIFLAKYLHSNVLIYTLGESTVFLLALVGGLIYFRKKQRVSPDKHHQDQLDQPVISG